MTFINFFHKYTDIINTISNIFTALGTISAVITALWLSNKGEPKLRVYATVQIIFPDNKRYLGVSSINIGKQSITCTNFAFNPNKFKNNPERIMFPHEIKEFSTSLPKLIQYSERVDRYYKLECFADPTIARFLNRKKWLASIQLKYFWRVIVTTNIKEFEGKLSSSLIDEILLIHFNTQTASTNNFETS